jgi:transcriptional regulator with XRE-family HTH domain
VSVLGIRIKELRVRAGWSLSELAAKSGVPLHALQDMEAGVRRPADGRTLVAASDALRLGIDELAYLLCLNQRCRKFQAYCVGLPKSGTSSIAGIFSAHVSRHEFMVRETVEHLIRFQRGELDDGRLRSFVRRRDAVGLLEMDSASFNGAYLEYLRDEFPSAKFLLTIRDCCSWLDSLLNMVLERGKMWAPWAQVYVEHLFGLKPSMYRSRRSLLEALDTVLDDLLAFWAARNRKLLAEIPRSRSLIVPTSRILDSIEDMASLVGIPAGSLDRGCAHAFRATRKHNLLGDLDYSLLKRKLDLHCGELSEALFPGHTLRRFLEA